MLRKLSLSSLIALALVAILVTNAFALVTFDPTCSLTPSNSQGKCGFVGKGDVQIALGWNNAKLQANAGSLAFTYKEEVTQAVSQSVSQTATQYATQTVSEILSCTIDTHKNDFHRDGSRNGTRSASRSGTRGGLRSGTISGTLSYAIAYDPRVRNQITGFLLTGKGPYTALWDAPVWGDPTWDEWAWTNDFSWGDTTWGDWVPGPDNEPATADPNVCLNSSDHVIDLVHTVTEGDVVGGDIQYGEINTTATIIPGAITVISSKLYVNGVQLP